MPMWRIRVTAARRPMLVPGSVCHYVGVVVRVSSPVFVGRVEEIAELEAAVRRVVDGRPATVVVAGEAGVGKSRLVAELASRAAERGVITLTGTCLDVGDGELPYAPIAETLRQLRMSLDE